MADEESLTEKVSDIPDDPKAEGLIDELGARAEAEREGRSEKPGDPTPEDMQRLHEVRRP